MAQILSISSDLILGEDLIDRLRMIFSNELTILEVCLHVHSLLGFIFAESRITKGALLQLSDRDLGQVGGSVVHLYLRLDTHILSRHLRSRVSGRMELRCRVRRADRGSVAILGYNILNFSGISFYLGR